MALVARQGMGREVGPDGVTRRDVNAGKRAGLERWAGVGHTDGDLEVHAVVGVAVGATDALAVGGERGRGAVGHRARRGPTPQHYLGITALPLA